ncbi:unnamed protein product [Ceratitis capitata]|uniref:(Mediterranean fruit fly) hypothetical protein n=1 Tax=Ceratitis capitata TaxID=7213 RepID=A0A811UPE9_CERCA|nr:unnamed protein product [Ceratitis capitata]
MLITFYLNIICFCRKSQKRYKLQLPESQIINTYASMLGSVRQQCVAVASVLGTAVEQHTKTKKQQLACLVFTVFSPFSAYPCILHTYLNLYVNLHMLNLIHIHTYEYV